MRNLYSNVKRILLTNGRIRRYLLNASKITSQSLIIPFSFYKIQKKIEKRHKYMYYTGINSSLFTAALY